MTTLIPTSQQQQQATTTPVAAPPAGVESYEDMFKEITRKLYGDESAHGLYPINNTQVAQLAQTPSAPPEGERSFTTLVSDRSLVQLEYENVMPAEIASGNFKSEEHLSTAFGLAALMHNGFPPPTINFPVTSANNTKQTTQSSGEDRQWNQQQNHHQQNQQQEEGGITWNNNKASNTYTQKLFKVKTKQEPVAQEITTANGTNIKSEHTQVHKRYNCLVCPYSTDRRDLFTRHENIHKEEKPFHCYACLKQFNRADHVKKHFLRMHREMEYDINKTRRYPPSSKQVNSISSNNNSSNKNNNNNYFYNQPQQTTAEPQQLLVGTTINIPTFSQNQATNNNNNNNGGSQQHNTTTIIEHVVHNSGSTSSAQAANVNAHQVTTVNIKHEKMSHSKSPKSKGEKRFMCCYCPWSGADNWGLKRHLNTHTKPFVCLLCDYKAARSERLTTHIFKVHNKKACNKCNFFADDQAQLAQHQLDAHQNEVRNVRTSNNQTNNSHPSTTPALTVNNISIGQPVSSVVSNQSTTNVLRTLTNTFVPNIHHAPQTNHTFGSSNAPSSLNNVTSSIYTTSNVNTNLVEQLNHHLTSSNNWRTVNSTNNSLSNLNLSNLNGSNRIHTSGNSLILTPTITTTSSSLKRKSGADRLFAYFEADDSDDIELDYARQLQMQALSRNTASVAQDFRSAGGENFITNAILQDNKGTITLTSVNRDATENGAIGYQHKKKSKATSPILQSPPAVILKAAGLASESNKRRRKMSPFNDKENVNELLTKQLTFLKQQHMVFLKNLNESVMSDSERVKTVQEINEIFETMYNNSLSLITSIETEKRPKSLHGSPNKYSLPDFLTNNNEITVIMEPKLRNLDSNECRKNRKQLKPKKIEKGAEDGETGRSIISDLRDKHMVRLVTRKKYCFSCRNKSSDANSVFNKTSLLLHKLWRHSGNQFECHQCQSRFSKIYKLKLHKKLKKH